MCRSPHPWVVQIISNGTLPPLRERSAVGIRCRAAPMNNPYYMVVDLEATCSDDGSVPKHQMEVIEIGAVMVAADSLEPVSEYQSFVRPVRIRS